MKFRFTFESSRSGNFVGVLSEPASFHGPFAAQNAGSSNPGIYYQVGGGGVNGLFFEALGGQDRNGPPIPGPINDAVNADLQTAYDSRFGAGAWKKDQNGVAAPLTSFLIPLPAKAASQPGARIGAHAVAMVYSVGPQIPHPSALDAKQYRGIYVDAFQALCDANQAAAPATAIGALRLAMLSVGIYGPTDPKEAKIVREAVAGLILDALELVAKGSGASHLPSTFLVNCGPKGDESGAFAVAAQARNINVASSGFDFDV